MQATDDTLKALGH